MDRDSTCLWKTSALPCKHSIEMKTWTTGAFSSSCTDESQLLSEHYSFLTFLFPKCFFKQCCSLSQEGITSNHFNLNVKEKLYKPQEY